MSEQKEKVLDREQVTILKTPIQETGIKAGDFALHYTLGEGVVVGFSSVSNNPTIFFYKYQAVICVSISSVKKIQLLTVD